LRYVILNNREQTVNRIMDLSTWSGPSWFSVSVLWVSVNLVSREIKIPSNSLASALLRYMPRYEAGSALDLLPPL